MNKREKFLMFTYLAGIARDLRTMKNETEQIVAAASQVPESRIPVNEFNASQVFIACADGRTKPFKWMKAGKVGRWMPRVVENQT